MNCPLLPVIPAFDDELGALGLDVEDALDPLGVLNDPFQAPRHPV
jgi:hypothetical protein